MMAVNLGMTWGLADMEHEETIFSSQPQTTVEIYSYQDTQKVFNPNFMLPERNAEIGDGLRERKANQ